MSVNSKQKGIRAERELAKICRAEGYDVHRTNQFSGKNGQAADCIGLPGIHIECKHRQKLNLYDAIAQATRDSEAEGKGNLPVVFHKKDYCSWLVTMRIEDFFTLYRLSDVSDRDELDETDE